ncbi:2-amino-4-hydroxy-6-hydroxymethyldihydropteridine diphosphokinase [Geomicrobium sp. JCM 19055]|uniref:2-amino-4-hydroxy-6- hydroxymethyldihydropteridine diphosphokinase n=1 Tax=Geomicrobium sp. JCM 19055 TaxID=1460649 RepID=UPI00045EDC2F|nr:2-amino-4-hydroxy-6-hydroxymethyldihydropteridine diphosphokinase [Geomicrobium sp. JCM 19055]GAK01802.1 2-amino-4-hydroxy-6-hydroxymethyldihydropteridine pyrophosphokinase [Geomicrobium sp. JCM 19055]
MKHTAYIALGSNINPREEYLKSALQAMVVHEQIAISSVSSIYETEPVGYLDQSQFLNMVCKVETTLRPMDLLLELQRIERELHRTREILNGPRTIDLDILLFNDENIKLEQLCIPHPRMEDRAFVLAPLQEIAPLEQIPTLKTSVHDLFMALPERLRKGVLLWKQQKQVEEFVPFEN